MSFDRLAPHYRWMEFILAGRKLQRCRMAFLPTIPAPHRALLLGEGNGRFLVELLRAYPNVQITCLDASSEMLAQARSRVEATGLNTASIHFVHARISEWSPPPEKFDLIVSHFFLDCFRAEQLPSIVRRISDTATSDAHWLLADFCEAPAGLAKWRTRIILKLMYFFFRYITHLPAHRLTSPDPFLTENRFTLRERSFSDWNLLHSDLWIRQPKNL